MDAWNIEIEADSLDEAWAQLYTLGDLIILQATPLCCDEAGLIEAIADTIEDAFIKARGEIPAGAKIEKEEVKIAPRRASRKIKGEDEESAIKEIILKEAEVIESISLHKKRRRGFLGFFKSPNVYKVAVARQAVVAVKFRVRAKLQATVRGYLAKDLLQLIQECRRRGAEWSAILQSLNPKKDKGIEETLWALRVPDIISSHAVLEAIECECHKNEAANWRTAIKAGCQKILDVQSRKQVELRALDHKIADYLMLYTHIYWDRHYHKLTGIPRYDWDNPRHPDQSDEVLRETIPRYSSDINAFRKLESRLKGSELYKRYSRILQDEVQADTPPTLEQRCIAILKAKSIK